ncbi:MAG: hypothetical protein AAFV01_17205, partial [Bacteroidota bacterium]
RTVNGDAEHSVDLGHAVVVIVSEAAAQVKLQVVVARLGHGHGLLDEVGADVAEAEDDEEVARAGELGVAGEALRVAEGRGVVDGENGLFEGQLLAGLSPETVYGEPYTPGEWVTTRAIANIDAPEGFDEAVETVFESSDGALQVTLRAFTAANSPVFLEYEVLNQSGADVSEVYVGPFADWDVGTFSSNLADFDAGTNLLYVFDNSDPESTYFGIAALFSNAAPVSGANGSLDLTLGTDDGELYEALTSLGGFGMVPGDRRAVLGTGPWAVNDGDTVLARFALVAGESLAAITNAAGSAQAAFPAPTGFDTGLVQTEILP